MKKKVVLGLSDGVDSAVAAHLLKQDGWDVHGLYLDIAGENERRDAMQSAETLGIPLKVREIRPELEQLVCKPFIQSYLAGETPNPCIGCNPKVKLPALLRYADEIGAEMVATGHYVRKIGRSLYTGNPDNDQSYMLARLPQNQVDRLLLPLGNYCKEDVRKIANNLHLRVSEKPDSLENCFIPKGMPYAEWIASRSPVPGKGDVFFHGKKLSEHDGIYRYTVGQRWSEDYEGRRLYVSAILPKENKLILVLWEELFTTEIRVRDLSFIGEKPQHPFRASVRVRHTRWEQPECTVTITEDKAVAICDSPLRAPAPGQAAAFYEGEKLLGGGYLY